MPEVRTYQLPPTRLIPNSPYPLLHYPNLFKPSPSSGACNITPVHDILASNNWRTQWIFRYGATQRSHYHSRAHECMVVLSGSATIRFGVADTTSDLHSEDELLHHEPGGIEIEANAGDVFVLPAGTAHKTHNTRPEGSFALLTPGDGHGVGGGSLDEGSPAAVRQALGLIELSGFTMIGAYPEGQDWDSREGGEDEGRFASVWRVEKPDRDPVLGTMNEGLCGQW